MPATDPDLSFQDDPLWRAGVKLHYARVAVQEGLSRLLIPEPVLVRWKYRRRVGRPLDLKDPRTFTEKVQWRKLHGSSPLMRRLSDKVRVRDYVDEVLGADALIPLVGVWEAPEALPVPDLPDAFAAKANHGCGYNLLVRNKAQVDWRAAFREMHRWLSHDYSRKMAERQYRGIPRRILVEELLLDDAGSLPADFKIHCFRDAGEARLIVQVDQGRFRDHTRAFFDEEWTPLDIQFYRRPAPIPPSRPAALAELLEAARALSKPFSYVRVDLFSVADRVYFGEMTFTPGSGYYVFQPPDVDREWGDMWALP